VGSINNFGDVWFNTNSLANILSMAKVPKVCCITMDTSVEAAMHVHQQDGTVMKFQEFESGLYYFYTEKQSPPTNDTSHSHTNYLFLNTVAGNKDTYTWRKIEGADAARALYKKIGRPSQNEYAAILQNDLILNCPVTPDNAKRALIIYGSDVVTLQGKTVKKQNNRIPGYQPVLIPAPIIAKYSNIRLFVDIFWVNGSPYFHTILEWIKFCTVAAIKKIKPKQHCSWKHRRSSTCTRHGHSL
jgi:hypothetical protein